MQTVPAEEAPLLGSGGAQHGRQDLTVHKFLAEDGQRADLSRMLGGSPPPEIELSIWANSM